VNEDLANLPLELRQRLEQELEPGERVVYAGRPTVALDAGDGFVITFFLWLTVGLICGPISDLLGLSGGVLGFWSIRAAIPAHISPDQFAYLANLPRSSALGLALFASPFIYAAYRSLRLPFDVVRCSRRIVQSVTDRRVVTVCLRPMNIKLGRLSVGAQSYAAGQLTSLHVSRRANGRCIITIGVGRIKDEDGRDIDGFDHWAPLQDGERAVAAIEALMGLQPSDYDLSKQQAI
jgi:hypothetical protein